MVTRTVLDVGNCGPDHSSLTKFLRSKFDVLVLQTHGASDTLQLLSDRKIDLVLINRKLDRDYSDGLDIVKLLKSGETTAQIPVMLITNYEEHQVLAMKEGAVRGFGKLELNLPETLTRLAEFLSQPTQLGPLSR